MNFWFFWFWLNSSVAQIFETKLVSLPGEMNRSADFGRQSEWPIKKLQSSHGMLIALLKRATL